MIPVTVARTEIESIGSISTIQLPPDQSYSNPFETMIFYNQEGKPEYQRRHATLDEALLGHVDAIVYAIGEQSK